MPQTFQSEKGSSLNAPAFQCPDQQVFPASINAINHARGLTRFTLRVSTTTMLSITITNLQGRQITMVFDGIAHPGTYILRWNHTNDTDESYLAVLKTDGARPMTIVRPFSLLEADQPQYHP
jgi:hypothetical protein